MAFDRDDATFKVLVNHELQYSLWPDGKAVPAGWRETEQRGSKADCLAYVEREWVDMRPLSLRQAMSGQAAEQ